MGTATNTITVIPYETTGRTNMTTSTSYPESRGYNGIENGSFARWSLSTSTTGYIYYKFDTSEIPATATITSVTAKARAYVGNTTRVTNTVCQLYSGTTAKGSNATFASTLSSNIVTLSPGNSWTRSDLNDLRIRIGATGSSSTSSKYVYFAGAEVYISYSVTTYTCSASGDGTLNPSGSVDIVSGGKYELQISGVNSPTVTDNNVDVTSQLVQTTDLTVKAIPESNTNSGWYSVTDISKAYDDADSDDYASLELAGRSTGTIYLTMSDLNIPSTATIKSVSAKVTLQYNRNNSSSGFSSSVQMYAGSTAKGSATNWVSAGGTDVAKTTLTLTVGSWTASEVANAKLYLTATNNASSTRRYVYIYGASFEVTYESDGVIYIYTISSVTANHTIVVTAGAVTNKIYYKNNGSWVVATKVYKKVNGSWVQQVDLTTVFDPNTNYVKG